MIGLYAVLSGRRKTRFFFFIISFGL